MTFDEEIQILGLVAQLATSVAAALIALVTYTASRRSYVAQSRAALLTMINDFNELALTNDACLATFERMLTGRKVEDLEAARETWAAYSLLNNRQLHFYLSKTSHTGSGYLEQDRKNLISILKSTRVQEVLQKGGYDPDFLKYCDEAIKCYASSESLTQSSAAGATE